MGLRTQCDADGEGDEERKRMFFGEHVPSLSIFQPIILEGRTGRWATLREQIKSRDLKEHFHKYADNSASYSLPSAFHFCLNNPGIWDNFLSVLSLSPFALGKQPICSFMAVCPAFPRPGLCPHHSFHQVPLSLSPSVSQSEPSEKPSLLLPPLL